MNVIDLLLNKGPLGGLFGNQPIGTPPFNPNAPDPRSSMPAAQSPIDGFLNRPGGAMLMNLLAQSGRSLTPGPGPLGAIGRAYLATQGQQRQAGQDDLNEQLIRSQIGLNELRGAALTNDPEGRIGKLTPTLYTPDSVQRFYQSVNGGNPDYSLLEFRPELRVVTGPAGDVRVIDTGSSSGGGGTGDTSPDRVVITEEDAIAARAGAKAAETEAGGDPARERSLPSSLLEANQALTDVDDTIAAIESGSLKTGPVQGAFSQYSPEGELLRKLGNLKVIDLISKATFGQLSEGERAFLDKVAFGLGKTEEFNVDELKKFRRILVKAMEIEQKDAERLGVGDSDIDEIAAKYE